MSLPEINETILEITNKKSLLLKKTFQNYVFSEIDSVSLKIHLKSMSEGLNYVIYTLKEPSNELLILKLVKLAKNENSNRKTLFLDLDETLIHKSDNGDYTVKDETNEEIKFYMRPYCLEFLKNMSKLYEIYIFTASVKCYAEAIVDFLDPDCKVIEGIINREACLKSNNNYIKDLRVINNRNIKDLILVDNNCYSFGKTYENGIPIVDYFGDENDKQLVYLEKYLLELVNCDDVREINRKRFHYEKIANILN